VNSNYKERINLMEEFRAIFLDVEVAYLTGDSKVIGEKWFNHLRHKKWTPFRIRVKHKKTLRIQ
jgi:hypothetical protein